MIKYKNSLLVFFLHLTAFGLFGQTPNPFDLKSRLPKTQLDSLGIVSQKENNPFDISNKREISKSIFKTSNENIKAHKEIKFNPQPISSLVFFWFYMGMFAFIALVTSVS